MKTLKLIPIVLFLLVATIQTTLAQKVGHMNSDLLLSELPEIKAAAKQLETYSVQKEKEITDKAAALEKFYVETMTAAQKGELSPIQQQQKETELQQKQAALDKAQKTAQAEILKRQETLYQPVLDKVDAAIKAVGEENGYDYIFNTNGGSIIHAGDSDDVTALVKRKLGI